MRSSSGKTVYIWLSLSCKTIFCTSRSIIIYYRAWKLKEFLKFYPRRCIFFLLLIGFQKTFSLLMSFLCMLSEYLRIRIRRDAIRKENNVLKRKFQLQGYSNYRRTNRGKVQRGENTDQDLSCFGVIPYCHLAILVWGSWDRGFF